MSPILVQSPELGLNALVQENLLDPRAAANGSQNLFYHFGLMQTPSGFAKFDLTTGLNSGDTVLAIPPFREIDGFDHVLAVTTEKIFDHDAVNSTWVDKTQSGLTMASAIDTPVSWAIVGHDDSAIFLNDDSGQAQTFHHIVICNGGLGNIQRWAGRFETDFADVVGGGGYHGSTTHRALQAVMSQQNRMLLLSPQDFNVTSNLWEKNNQQIRWPQIGKLESWAGTGSGFVNLQDTGGINVWSASLGSQHVIYQTQGIWNLNHVGGTRVFNPVPVIPDLGLLAAHLLISFDNVHYFIGTDLNVHAYFGGSVKQTIGDPIHKFLQQDLNKQHKNRMRIVMGPNRERLWIFIVEVGQIFITKAYYRNMQTGKWGVRDFSSKFGSGTGITAVSLVGSQTTITGDSYAQALDMLSSYQASDNTSDTAADVTQRYGDVIEDGTVNQLDWSTLSAVADYDFSINEANSDFSTGGLFLCFSYSNDPTGLVGDDTAFSNKIIRIDDGSDSDLMPNGSHFYTITDVSSVKDGATTDYTVKINFATVDTGRAVCATAAQIPVWGGDTTATLFDPSGLTYRQAIEEVETEAQLLLGDATGLVFQVDETYTDDDGSLIDARHLTPVFDLGIIGKNKRWQGIRTVADGTIGGAMTVRERTSNFDTSETGWVDYSFDLTIQWQEKTFYTNKTSKRIQYEFKDFSGNQFKVREFEVLDPVIEDNR